MIKTEHNKSQLSKIKSLLVVAPYISTAKTKELSQHIKKAFPSSVNVTYLFVIEKVLKDHDFYKNNSIFYVTPKDFNLFGKVKTKDILPLSDSITYDAMLCSCFETNKIVKKALNKIKNKLSIGVNQNGLYNFDIGLIIQDKSDKRLIDQTVKYLNQL